MFNAFILLSLFYCFIGVRVIAQLARRWHATWDRSFTPGDRALVDQAAFFILLPISVALHELGHATAIWSFGGHVSDFGFYVFAGYVSYAEPFSNVQRIIVAMAGPLVSVVLGVLAVAVVFAKRPPMRAAYNELLLQFALLDIINVLVFYPLLDLASGLEGDWSQMYFGHVPALSLAILVVHVGILAFGYWAWKDPGMRARVATLTGAPVGAERSLLGGFRRSAASPSAAQAAIVLNPTERVLRDAAARVVSGWPTPVEAQLKRGTSESVLTLAWRDGAARRAVLVWATPDGFDLWGAVAPDDAPPPRRHLDHLPPGASDDRLTLALRLAMEDVAGWQAASGDERGALGGQSESVGRFGTA